MGFTSQPEKQVLFLSDNLFKKGTYVEVLEVWKAIQHRHPD